MIIRLESASRDQFAVPRSQPPYRMRRNRIARTPADVLCKNFVNSSELVDFQTPQTSLDPQELWTTCEETRRYGQRVSGNLD